MTVALARVVVLASVKVKLVRSTIETALPVKVVVKSIPASLPLRSSSGGILPYWSLDYEKLTQL
ncbi:MAG: hypothetical protein RLP02_14150 [Coleofasciculus sp. C2-GNP5-27]